MKAVAVTLTGCLRRSNGRPTPRMNGVPSRAVNLAA
jgi:hypothetical protein